MPGSTKPDSRKTIFLLCVLLVGVTIIVFNQVVQHDFVNYDDSDYIYQNQFVRNGLTATDTAWAFTTFHCSNWHPLTWLSHQLDCQLFGLNPGPQHLVNLLFHSANAVLLFLLLFRMTKSVWPAGAVAALFAWHPLHVESVAWLAERKDVLSTFFGLLSLLCYARYFHSHVGKDKRWQTSWMSFLFFVLSLLAKPMLVTLPFVLLLLDYWPLARFPNFKQPALRRLILEKWPFFIVTVASCIITYLAQRSEAVVSFEKLPLGMRLANAFVACLRYLGKIFWPVDLAVIYPLPHQIQLGLVAVAIGVLAVISGLAWQCRRTKPWLLVGWLWFLGTLVPVIGIIQVGGQAMADRYTYFPAVGIFIILAWGFQAIAASLRLSMPMVGIFSTIILVALGLLTENQVRYWNNSETLFTHTVKVTTDNDIALINLGESLEAKGEPDQALPFYYEALRINPTRAHVHNNIANILSVSGHRSEAIAQYQEASRLKPNASLPHFNLAVLYTEMGETDKAMDEYTEAASLDPDDPLSELRMAKICLRLRRDADAITHLQGALRRDPNDVEALTYLAHLLASGEHSELRDGAQATALAQKANSLSGGDQPVILDTLAMAWAETGRYQEAQEAVQKAIQLAGSTGQTDLVFSLEQHLKLYQSGQPFRESSTNLFQ